MTTPSEPEPESAVADVGSAGSLSQSYPSPSGVGCLLFGATVPAFVVGMVFVVAEAYTAAGIAVTVAGACCVAGLAWMIVSYVRRLRQQGRELRATPRGAALQQARSAGNVAVARIVLPGVAVFIGCAVAGSLLHPAWWAAGAIVMGVTSVFGARARGRAERQWNQARTDLVSSEKSGDTDAKDTGSG